jgi:hypothetical protein
MTAEMEFAGALSRALGPLYRVTVLDGSGAPQASFGTGEAGLGQRFTLRLPNSDTSICLEFDVGALEAADRLLHALAAPYQLAETSLGAFAHLEDALTSLIAQAEAAIGTPIAQMTRSQKQHLVRFLDERGAFTLRKAVERVADSLGVSRFTVYNYLDSARGT